jgi:hypothetical protein
MTHSAGGQRNRSSAGLSGGMSWQLTASDVISLAINVVQNGLDCRKLRPGLAYLLSSSAVADRVNLAASISLERGGRRSYPVAAHLAVSPSRLTEAVCDPAFGRRV